jgi:uncharacterized caspase-like protein
MAETTHLETTSLETFWSAPLPAQRAHGFARNLAVVIGINAYSNGIPTLTTAVNDVQQVARALHVHHHYATHLLVENVTLAQLTTVFAQMLPQLVGPQDRFLVYFAGHGIAMDRDDGPAGYLILADSSPHDRQTFLPMDELQRWLNALACRHLLVVLDCCFAGAFRWASSAMCYFCKMFSTRDAMTALLNRPHGKLSHQPPTIRLRSICSRVM